MNAIARFAMQGPRQAALISVLFAAIPLMYWVSAAVVALVILRQGLSKGFNVLLPALLPGIAWYAAQQEITVFMVVLGCALMAAVLRISVSLPKSIAASTLLGLAVVLLFPVLSPAWLELLQEFISEYSKLASENSQATTTQQNWTEPQILGGIAVTLQFFAIGALLLARSWQSTLFNPGEFSKEFQSFRLPIWYVLVALVVLFIGVSNADLAWGIPIVLIPLVIMGISVVHSVVAIKQLSSQWLVTFYISLVIFRPYMYALLILVALLDVLFNIRGKLNDTAN